MYCQLNDKTFKSFENSKVGYTLFKAIYMIGNLATHFYYKFVTFVTKT